jgi:hypothetical protein
MFDFLPSSVEHVRAGKLRALAIASAKRWPALPDFTPARGVASPANPASPKSSLFDAVQGVLHRLDG